MSQSKVVLAAAVTLALVAACVGVSEPCTDVIVNCFRNPCDDKTCPNYPAAECRENNCGSCFHEFFLYGQKLSDEDCNGCRPVTCKLYCEHGWAKDPVTGCDICACADPPLPSCRQQMICPRVVCPPTRDECESNSDCPTIYGREQVCCSECCNKVCKLKDNGGYCPYPLSFPNTCTAHPFTTCVDDFQCRPHQKCCTGPDGCPSCVDSVSSPRRG